MEDSRIFEIEGEPAAKGRPRFRIFGRHVTAYTPAKTKKAEKEILNAYNQVHGSKEPITGSIMLTVEFYMGLPKSMSKKKKEQMMGRWCIKRPDVDNLLKTVQDALNGVAWKDDSQIVCCTAKKTWALTEPKTRVIIQDLTNY